ncbi:MAG: DOMON-like domain-containing protein [Deltaproteobacteria bacterium]|nr:DOMON-like domain-containing protein [Candidatus Deferrimicrobiaceae bacterium]
MNPLGFSLIPFPTENNSPEIRITGSVGRRESRFSIACTIQGNLAALAIPAPASFPVRKDRLWEETCLEFFLGASDSEVYWEFNLSPAGHWNVYRFTSYRQGMREEPAFASLPFRIREEPGSFGISMERDVGKILPNGDVLKVAVAAVIRTIKGDTSHWALAHAGHRPDFHRRESFLLNLSGK